MTELKSFVAYYRVSTQRQGLSGLGMAAQKSAVASYISGQQASLVGEFTEVESGQSFERPQLRQALLECRKRKATLVIAKLDRLSRNVAFIAALLDSGVEFVASDNPHATKLTIHILAAVAQHEREMIAERTKQSLRAARSRGTRLGRYGASVLSKKHRAEAVARARSLEAMLMRLKQEGASLRKMANSLESAGIKTVSDGRWHPQTVSRMLRRLTPGLS